MAESHSTVSPEAGKTSSISHPPVPVIQTAPDHDASDTSAFDQQKVNAMGMVSLQRPLTRRADVLQMQRRYGNSAVQKDRKSVV